MQQNNLLRHHFQIEFLQACLGNKSAKVTYIAKSSLDLTINLKIYSSDFIACLTDGSCSVSSLALFTYSFSIDISLLGRKNKSIIVLILL